MNKIHYLLLGVLLLGAPITSFSIVMNWIVADVANNPITIYDIDQNYEFNKISGQLNITKDQAFRDLVFTYGLISLANTDKKYQIQEEEISKILHQITNTTESEDIYAKERSKLYYKYPDIFKLQLKKSQIVRSLFFYNEDLKEKANKEPNIEEVKKIYESKKEQFILPPEVDVINFTVKQREDLDFDQLIELEKNMKEISELLKKSDDVKSIFDKYKKIKFESYSGRSGKKIAAELVKQGYPEEVVGLPLQEEIALPTGKIKITEGTVIFIPQPIPLRNFTGKYYLIIKVLKKELPRQLTFEEAKQYIEPQLKNEMVGVVIEDYIKDLLVKKQISVTIMDTNFMGAYNEILRR